jgi:hypothetical protein
MRPPQGGPSGVSTQHSAPVTEISDGVDMKYINDQPEGGVRLDTGSMTTPQIVPETTLPDPVDDTTLPKAKPGIARDRYFDMLVGSLRPAEQTDNGVPLVP